MHRDLHRLSSRRFDVAVIGGGIHGAVVAWDAAARGLSVALIERGDFGCATSQNSLKIIHGGLRYLPDGSFRRIRTMASERTTWMRIAPHLVHPLSCVTPTWPGLSRSRFALGAALSLNDLLSFDRNQLADPGKMIPGGRLISTRELARLLPGYDVGASTGAAIWADAQVYNSERLLLEVVLSAVAAGAEAANYVEAVGFLRQGDRILGVRAKDVPSGQVFDIQAKLVINAAGAWIDQILEGVGARSGYATSIAMNLIVDQVWPDVAAGLPSRPTGPRRPQVLFIVPWRGRSMIGTWHIPWNDAPGNFKPSNAIVQEFVDEANSAHPSLELSLENIRHVTWGYLPVHRTDAGRGQVKLTRDGVVIDHQKKDGLLGLMSVLGVKYTTARVVGERAVDLATKKIGIKARSCQTQLTPVSGGQIRDFSAFLAEARSATSPPLAEEIIEHLAYSYGSDYPTLVQMIKARPELARRIDPSLQVTEAEVIHAVRHEMALTLLDVVRRRTELGAAGLPSLAVLQSCADLVGRELTWDAPRQAQEIDSVLHAYLYRPMERVLA